MPDEQTPRYAIYEHVGQTTILNVYDCLAIERILFEAKKYDRQTLNVTAEALCYLEITDAKVLIFKVLGGQLEGFARPFERVGGSPRDGEFEARSIQVRYDTANGRFDTMPWAIGIQNGKGKTNDKGGITFDGKPHTFVAVRFSIDDFLGICLEIRDYLLSHQRQIEKVRAEKQQVRRDKRMKRDEAEPPQRPTITGRQAGRWSS